MDIFNAFIQPFITLAPKLPNAIINFIIGFLIIKIAIFVLKRSIKYLRLTKAVRGLIVACASAFLWAFLVIHLLDILGLGNLIVLISGSAIFLGFILNQGLAQTISDIVSSIALAQDKDFKIGTKISINEGKTVGEIVSLSMRKVRILDKNGTLHVVPNSVIDKAEWVLIEGPIKNESHKSKK
ncbi:MAG: mechanosensitive ion channel domain-containing protein [Patescibacteria group bacterium]|jgi:small-conductance mechanosensitive channel|nr:mechanosensitive ion channel [Patescibacteria group bacterium]